MNLKHNRINRRRIFKNIAQKIEGNQNTNVFLEKKLKQKCTQFDKNETTAKHESL